MAPTNQSGGLDGGATSSCLTVFGLTFDATEREVHILFSGCPGFVRCIVVPPKDYGKKPYAFVQFDRPDNAFAAMDARQGSSWEAGGQVINMEMSKRDIPDHFQSRQVESPAAYQTPVLGPPALKRPRVEASSFKPVHSAPAAWSAPAHGQEDGPRTLHLGGLPAGIQQVDLEDFLVTNFGAECLGGKIAGGGRGDSARAFVGFVSHAAAASAQASLMGFNWDGYVLHAEWAKTEYRPLGGAAAEAPQPVYQQPVYTPTYGSKGSKGSKGAKGSSKGGKGGSGDSRCTLHFTNLPFVSEDEFDQFMEATFPGQIECSRFTDKQDGRPPVAWVRCWDEATATHISNEYANFDWSGQQVAVQFARTELDPTKVLKR